MIAQLHTALKAAKENNIPLASVIFLIKDVYGVSLAPVVAPVAVAPVVAPVPAPVVVAPAVAPVPAIKVDAPAPAPVAPAPVVAVVAPVAAIKIGSKPVYKNEESLRKISQSRFGFDFNAKQKAIGEEVVEYARITNELIDEVHDVYNPWPALKAVWSQTTKTESLHLCRGLALAEDDENQIHSTLRGIASWGSYPLAKNYVGEGWAQNVSGSTSFRPKAFALVVNTTNTGGVIATSFSVGSKLEEEHKWRKGEVLLNLPSYSIKKIEKTTLTEYMNYPFYIVHI